MAWTKDHPSTILAFALGLAIGFLMIQPLGFTVSGNVAQVMATVVTSLFAIGGALVIWQAQELRRETTIASAIAISCIPLTQAISRLSQAISEATALDSIPAEAIRTEARELKRAVKETRKRLARHHATHHSLSATRVLATIHVEMQLATAKARAAIVIMRAQGDVVPSGAREVLLKDNQSLKDLKRSIEDDLWVLDPDFDNAMKFLVKLPSNRGPRRTE